MDTMQKESGRTIYNTRLSYSKQQVGFSGDFWEMKNHLYLCRACTLFWTLGDRDPCILHHEYLESEAELGLGGGRHFAKDQRCCGHAKQMGNELVLLSAHSKNASSVDDVGKCK